MKNKRNFDVTIEVSQNKETLDWDFKLSLSSVFKDSELPQSYKDIELGRKEYSEGDEKQAYIRMIYNFLKNNLNVEEKA